MRILITILINFSILFSHLQAQSIETKSMLNGFDEFELVVDVFNRESKAPIKDVMVYLIEMPNGYLIESSYTADGMVSFNINPEKDYQIQTCKKLHFNGGLNFRNCQAEGKIFCIDGGIVHDFATGGGDEKPNAMLRTSIALDSIEVGKTFKLNNIYYDLAKWDLRDASKTELDRLYDILLQFPSMKIELSSHTDARGSDADNLILSDKRANACYDYLIAKGIERSRIDPTGYGETKLVNACEDGSECGEKLHQMNRRTEFTVLSFEGEGCDSSESQMAMIGF